MIREDKIKRLPGEVKDAHKETYKIDRFMSLT